MPPHLDATLDFPALERIRRIPTLGELVVEAEQRLAAQGPDGLWACQPLFEALLRSGSVAAWVRSEIALLLDEPRHAPDGGADTIALVRRRRFSLSVKLLRAMGPRPAKIHSLPEHLMLGVLGPAPLAIDVYREAPAYPGEVFDRALSLEGRESRVLAPGDVACLHAGRDVLLPMNRNETTLALVLASDRVERQRRVYTVETGRAEGVVSADPTASRLEFAARILAELGAGEGSRDAAAEGLHRLCEHPAHFVRWTALRSLFRVDAGAGIARLRRALTDPHPHVRAAAARAVARIRADGRFDQGSGH
jgi:hypothetical protein